jgi:hypothetical protein
MLRRHEPEIHQDGGMAPRRRRLRGDSNPLFRHERPESLPGRRRRHEIPDGRPRLGSNQRMPRLEDGRPSSWATEARITAARPAPPRTTGDGRRATRDLAGNRTRTPAFAARAPPREPGHRSRVQPRACPVERGAEQPAGIEPASPEWQTGILPLDHGCMRHRHERNLRWSR